MLLGLALGMLTVGCTAGLNEEAALNNNVEIGVVLDDAARLQLIGQTATAVQLGWAEGDVIYVNGVKSEPIAAAYVGKAEGKFVVSGVTAPYKVVYAPAVNGDAISIPSVQAWSAKTLGADCAVFAGQSETAAVSLEAAVGFVVVTVTGVPAEVCDATIVAVGGEGLAGAGEVDFTSGTLMVDNVVKSVNVKNIAVNSGVAQFIAVVPAQTYATGLKVSIAAGDTEMVKTIGAAAGVEVKKGVAVLMPEVAYAGTPRALTIKSAADLQAFLTAVDAGDYAAYVNGAGEVLVENDIDLAGVELVGSVAVEGAAFKHVFNGQGYALKNWNVAGPLFADNEGTIKNIVVDSSCVWAPKVAGDHALIVLKNNGIISGIKSYVNVDVSDFVMDGSIMCGAVAARSYEQVVDCENYGSYSFKNFTWDGGTLTVGGVVAYAWYTEGETLLANCVNHGDITIIPAEGVPGKNYYVGGVLGATSQHGWAGLTAENNYGVIYNCVNNGDVYCERKGLLNGTYGNIAGVVGYAEADVIACTNNGNVSYINPDNTAADTAITRSAVAGVVACGCFSIEDCTNYGKIVMTGTHASGGSDTTAGCGAAGNPCAGGVVAQAGNKLGQGDEVTGCVNYGEVDINVSMRPANATAFQLGGAVGLTNVTVKDTANYGEVKLNCGMQTIYVAGAVGRLYQKNLGLENITNDAPVTLTTNYLGTGNMKIYVGGVSAYVDTTTAALTALDNGENGDLTLNLGKGQCYTANIIGYLGKGTVDGGSNKGNITVNDGHITNGNSYIGAIIGQSGSGSLVKNFDCEGDITVLSESQWRFGGLGGCIAGTVENCSYKGTLSGERNAAGGMGGVNGFGQASITNCTVDAVIKSNSTTPAGGLVGAHGNTDQNWNGNTVKFDIIAEGALCGILCGNNTAASKTSTVGVDAPNQVKMGSKINGVEVTAADCADILKVYGGITNMSQAVLAEGGVVLVE